MIGTTPFLILTGAAIVGTSLIALAVYASAPRLPERRAVHIGFSGVVLALNMVLMLEQPAGARVRFLLGTDLPAWA
eukprot:CAMPEP_0113701370 /NCGR_PEP_ID=MMETSP0038_2-20120614/24533_1 /TAXON_ID=2898 /ORGANISM="Cryptomonas paramecium" /LENGTH=75 /DNA_ID=CAMNT_0000625247 /DNA_START=403 /DNA_END=626 /DNA_ORIENTATION=+ /assembly_acc=CAM_ASM_000170